MAGNSGVSAVNRFLQTTIVTESFPPANANFVKNKIYNLLKAGHLKKAVTILFSSPFPFSFPLYSHLFQLCSVNKAIVEARKLESHLVTYYDPAPTFLLNRAIKSYAKCGCLRDARELFDEMPQRDGGSWNALVIAYARGGSPKETLSLFLDMNRAGFFPNQVAIATVLGCCEVLLGICFLRVVHGYIMKLGFSGNVIITSALVNLYGKCDKIFDARRMFDEMDFPNAVSWNVIVRRYLEVGDERQAISMFFQAIRAGTKPLTFTFSNALIACSRRRAFVEGIQIHGILIKCNYEGEAEVVNSLMNMYIKCNDVTSSRNIFDQLSDKDVVASTSIVSGYALAGRLEEAQELFEKMPERSTISWNAMLTGYVCFSQWEKALNFIFRMCQEIRDVDEETLNLMLKVFAALSVVEFGKQVHACIYRCGFESNEFVSNALIDMYERCGALRMAKICFYIMSGWKDTILMASFARRQMSEDFITMFCEMLKETTPNKYTFATVLAVCATKCAFKQGKELHGFMIRNGYNKDVVVLGATLYMFLKRRYLEYACKVFKFANPRDVILWNFMIIGFCRHGKAMEALYLFDLMKEIEVAPDDTTFQAVFHACVCGGFVDEGKRYFDAMSSEYQITAGLVHYECMVNLYINHGAMNELENLIKKFPFTPSSFMLTKVFAASVKYRNMRLGKWAAEKLTKLLS